MRKNSVLFKAFATVAIGLALTSCTDKIVEEIQPEEQSKGALPENIIAILPQTSDTKTTYSPVSGTNDIKVAWEDGDEITISPGHSSEYANSYKLTSSTGSQGVFSKVSGSNCTATIWGIYYPGDKIKSDVDFYNFTYTGQVQKKDNPTAHMDKYNAMMLWKEAEETTAETTTLNFRLAEISSCIHFKLRGQTFVNPKSISLVYVNDNGFVEPLFHENNVTTRNYYYSDGSKKYNGLQTTATLTLALDGYGTETSLDAYMMASNYTEIPGKGYLLVKVKCEGTSYFCRVKVSSPITLSNGKIMNITSKGKWHVDNVAYDDTEYSFDGEVILCKEPHPTTGPDLIIMGDGFIAEDIKNGTYGTIMNQAIKEFFAIQPFNKFADQFNVYYVKAVSPQRINPSSIPLNGAVGNGCMTKFNTVLQNNTTYISGNHNLVMEYAMKALKTNAEERLKDATIVVMVNTPSHAGTCWNFFPLNPTTDYGEATAIAYCALGLNSNDRQQLMYHEICGHGFGKLGDEYYYPLIPDLSNTKTFEDRKKQQAAGLWRNVDCYIDSDFKSKYSAYATWDLTDKKNVYWHDLFNTKNGYESKENLGIFKGAETYEEGYCRPTEDGSKSIMHYNTGCFNAPSRRQILYRMQKLLGKATYSFGSAEELNNFLSWDAANFVYPNEGETRANYVEQAHPIDPPVWVKGSWVDGHFIETEIAK